MFINLILNALQALPDNQHGIDIYADLDENRENMVIRVQDEGCGMSQEQRHKITEPFFTTRASSGGTGLGLSISTQIIQNHGGTLTFQSEVNQGTTVIVTLPVILSALDGLKT